jgi:plastocyanin
MIRSCVAGLILVLVWSPAASASGAELPERSLPAVTISLETVAPYYEPFVAVVPPGVPIRWVNPTASPHSIRHDGCLGDESCAFHSMTLPPDSSFMIAPLPPGRYTYHCELHPIMRGILVVLSESGAASDRSSWIERVEERSRR